MSVIILFFVDVIWLLICIYFFNKNIDSLWPIIFCGGQIILFILTIIAIKIEDRICR
jgi:hypothetical protein